MRHSLPLHIVLVAALLGCGADPPNAAVPKPVPPVKKVVEQRRTEEPTTTAKQPKKPTPAEVQRAVEEFAQQPRPATFADLVEKAKNIEFDLPAIDSERVAAAGIRKLSGQHLEIYTDLPPGDGAEEMPQVFDAAVPAWCAYFGIATEKPADWKLVASVMKDKEKFVRAGLYLDTLPGFQHGYNVGSQIWIYDQPSDYFRRHLLLHEGTHAFMLRWLGGAGPPWYMEGIAELVATHRWEKGKLQLAILPRTRDEVPYWGRVKIVKVEHAAGRGLSLIEIMRYDAHAHLKIEPYGWCWAAAAFLDAHPLTQRDFRELRSDVSDRSLEFSKRFYERVKGDWPAITQDWQIFVYDCDYGYDFARASVERKPVASLPAAGATVTIKADRGWQSSGILLEAGKSYDLEAQGRYQVAGGEKPWPCEAGGVTLRYVAGRPLGMLLAAVGDSVSADSQTTPLTFPVPVGLFATVSPSVPGTLYLKINEPAAELADNTGVLTIRIAEKK